MSNNPKWFYWSQSTRNKYFAAKNKSTEKLLENLKKYQEKLDVALNNSTSARRVNDLQWAKSEENKARSADDYIWVTREVLKERGVE